MVTDGSKILRYDASCRQVDRRRELDELRLGLQESVGRLSDIARSMPGMAQEASPTDLITAMFTEQTAALRRESEAVRRIEKLLDSALGRLAAVESDVAQSKEQTARETAKLRADVAAARADVATATGSAAEASTAAGDVRVRLDVATSTLVTQDGRLDHLERELGSVVRTACEAHRRAADELRAVEQRRAQAVAAEEANWADRMASLVGAEQEEHAKLRSEFRSALVGGLASAGQKQNDRMVEVRADLLRDLEAEREARLADTQETRQELARALAMLKDEQDCWVEAVRDTQAELTVLAGAVRTGLGCGRADSGGGGLPRRAQGGATAGSQWSAPAAAWKEAAVPKLDTEKKAEENEEEDFLRRWPPTATSDLVFEKPPAGAAVLLGQGLQAKKQGESSPLARQAPAKPPSLGSPIIAAAGKAEMIQEGGGRRWSSAADQRKQEVQEEKKKAEVQQEERRGHAGSQRAAARRAALKAMEAMEAAADKLERSTRSSSTGCLLEASVERLLVPSPMSKNK